VTIFSYFYKGGVSGDGNDGGSGDEENSEGEMSDDESPLNSSSWNVVFTFLFCNATFPSKIEHSNEERTFFAFLSSA
jgi:hypothetical protein